MSGLQLALNVEDLDASITFYSALFGTAPRKTRPGYANFAVAEPPLKLVLIENPGNGGVINHLGVEVTDTDAVDSELHRLREAGLASVEERGTTCCYATQDKFWVSDAPDGERWEIYTVLSDSETFNGPDAAQTPGCCAGDGAEVADGVAGVAGVAGVTGGAGPELAATSTACC